MSESNESSSSWLSLRWRALRAFSFPLSGLPVVVGAALVLPPAKWRWDILVPSVLVVVLLHAAGNLLNDWFDFRSGVDRRQEGDENRPGRLLVKGLLTSGQVMAQALVCLLLALPMAAYLVYRCGPEILWFGGGAALLLYSYTGPPFRFKYWALGEVVIFIVFGPLIVVSSAYMQTGQYHLSALLVSIPVGLVTTAVLIGGYIRDVEEDSAAKIHTIATTFGTGFTKVLYVSCVIVPPVVVVVLAALKIVSLGSLACLISLVPAGLLLRKVLTTPRLPDIDARTAKFATVFIVTLILGSAFSS
jgi:1,4-dihydroxy-2-naphthoate octaprenyltransferase